jgi:acyl dehydratase
VALAMDYLRSMTRLAWRSARGGRDHRAPSAGQLTVERWGLSVAPTELTRYVRATRAETLDEAVRRGKLLPPLYAAVWETRLLLELLGHPAAPVLRGAVVHLETELLQLRAAEASALFRCRLHLEELEEDARGVVLRVVTRCWNAAGQQCTESRSRFLLRDRARSVKGAGRRDEVREREEATAEREWSEVARWQLRSNHGRRYARASGDYNPAHLWRLTALALGYPRAILHGYCTAGLTAHALLTRYCSGNPAALRRFRIGFTRPILLPSRPRLLAADGGPRIMFRVVDDRDRDLARGELAASRE